MLFHFSGKGYWYRIKHFKDELWDRRLGVQTFGHLPSEVEGGTWYAPAAYSALKVVFDRLQFNVDSVLIDVGCGYGRPLFYLVSQYSVRKAVGIDANESFVQRALANRNNFKGDVEQISIECLFAQEFDYSEATHVYFYNPFDAAVLEVVLEQIKRTRSATDKALTIVYLNPIHVAVLAAQTWLQLAEQFMPSEVPSLDIGDRTRYPEGQPAVAIFKTKSVP